MDWTKPFTIKNIANGRIVIGALVIASGDTKEINPVRYSDKAIEMMKKFLAIEAIEVTNDFVATAVNFSDDEGYVTEVTSLKNEHGDTNSHVVYNPNKAINTEQIISGKPISVQSLLDESSAEYSDIDKMDAKEVLDQHWKTVQAEIKKITNKRKLALYLAVAREWAVADKKIEMLENRIAEL